MALNLNAARSWCFDHGLPIALAIAVGSLGTLYIQARDEAAAITSKVTKAETAARTAIQARYKAEEAIDDLRDAAESSKALAVFEMQQKLDACQKGAK